MYLEADREDDDADEEEKERGGPRALGSPRVLLLDGVLDGHARDQDRGGAHVGDAPDHCGRKTVQCCNDNQARATMTNTRVVQASSRRERWFDAGMGRGAGLRGGA